MISSPHRLIFFKHVRLRFNDRENGADTIRVAGVVDVRKAVVEHKSKIRRGYNVLQPEILTIGNKVRAITEQRELRLIDRVTAGNLILNKNYYMKGINTNV